MGNWDWESIRGYIPIIMVFIFAVPVIYFANRPPKHKQKNEEKKKQIIEKLKTIKTISLDQAKQLFDVLETYCELIINYTLRQPNEQD